MQWLSQQRCSDRIQEQLQILDSVDLAVNAPGLQPFFNQRKEHDVIRIPSPEKNRALVFPMCYIFTSFNAGYRSNTLAAQADQEHRGL